MWVASKYGFFSIVKKDGGWHIRARKAADLKLLQKAVGSTFAGEKIHLTPDADYCARIFITDHSDGRGAVQIDRIMSALGESVDYGNFKSMIAETPDQQDKLPAYHRMWSAMFDFQMSMASRKVRTWLKRI
jgi:hypothetical protein